MVLGMKNWLFTVHKAGLAGKIGGAFGSHTHSGEAPTLIYETMENVFGMNMEGMGPLRVEEKYIGTDEGMRTCQQFGKALASRA
ncbi:hypothetical protein FDZ71_09925 [bacterium]|nr:MAG: hypothetical protein FDZ71_09925 [bacterium]